MEDPRLERSKRHRLRERIILAMGGGMGGAEGWVEIEACGKANEAFVPGLLALPHGRPSPDPFGRVVALIDPKPCDASFVPGVQGISKTVKGVVALDGKTLRRSPDRRAGKKALHRVRAWAVEHRLVLAPLATEETSPEIPTRPLLLRQCAWKGGMVTLDARGTPRTIAEPIIEQEGGSALALKDHQGNRDEEVKATDALAEKEALAPVQAASDRRVEKGHGRLEIRADGTMRDPEILEHRDPHQKWKGLQALGMVRAERRIDQEISRETRAFVLRVPSVPTVASAVPSH